MLRADLSNFFHSVFGRIEGKNTAFDIIRIFRKKIVEYEL